MSFIVSKFGGTSVADANGFRRVRDILTRRDSPRIIILSAPGRLGQSDKITDLLTLAHQKIAEGEDASEPICLIRARYEAIIRELGLSEESRALFDSLEQDLRISRDHALSRGEYWNARLFAEFAQLPFVDAAELIHFDHHGRVLADETRKSIRTMARRYEHAVVPGFYGSLPDGEICTFSRGGSDITGALIAAALGAGLYENWTDVDGLMSADPSICPEAVAHPLASYRQMRRLAEAGAQVLHPSCLAPVSEANVPTLLKNTFVPEGLGTYISDVVRRIVPCVCCQDGKRLVRLDKLPMALSPMFRELSPMLFQSSDGDAVLLTGGDCSLITAFGLSVDQQEEAVSSLHPMATLFEEDCLRIVVPSEQKKEAVRALHDRLPLS